MKRARIISIFPLVVLTAGCGDRSDPARADAGAPLPASASGGHRVVGKAPAASGPIVSIVVLQPATARSFPAPKEEQLMDQFGLGFNPDFLISRVGQTIEFRNSEDVMHNVRVTETATKTPEFNVSPAPSESYRHTFTRPGFYAVTCDIHPSMRADILVTDTPYAAVAARDGSFGFDDVAPGAYRLTVMYAGRRAERDVEVSGPLTEIPPVDIPKP